MLLRDLPDVAGAECGCENPRIRNDADLRVAGLDELRGLGDIFSENEFVFHLIVVAGFFERLEGSAAVGSMAGIGHSDFLDGRI